MGIPKFFRWLTRRYPMILQNIQREEDCTPTDNLYLDLNGIVHNCIHGNDKQLHERVSRLNDLEEVWAGIMKAIDEIVHTTKPKKVLFLAVDGVAPRAKMNQQRARRFRSAKDSNLLKQQLIDAGKEAPDLFDSNAISPGTEFMAELSRQLAFFVQYKLNTDPLYQKLDKVVLSDGSIPGEGEHKMMDYIRQIKLKSDYDPNTRHCFYGADADLIMLSLMTHEPHFTIIREEHIIKKTKQGGVQRIELQKTNNLQLIHISLLREYFTLEYQEVAQKMKMKLHIERVIDDFVFFCFFIGNDFLPSLSALDIGEGSLDCLIDMYKEQLPTMTDYITESGKINWNRAEPFIQKLGQHEHETFQKRIKDIEYRKEQVVSIPTEAKNVMSQKDKDELIKLKIKEKTHQKKIQKVQSLTAKSAAKKQKKFLLMKKFEEDEISGVELSAEQVQHREDLLLKYRNVRKKQADSDGETLEDPTAEQSLRDVVNDIKEHYFSDLHPEEIPDDDVDEVSEVDINLDLTSLVENETSQDIETSMMVQAQIAGKYSEQNVEFMKGFIQQYSKDPSFAKAQYYKAKVKIDVRTEKGNKELKKMLKKYLEGLQWVLYYYYRGVQHWRWFYPYHYAPMISDLGANIVSIYLNGQTTIEQFEIDYNCSEVNTPYTPFQQLLSILPAKSAKLLPVQYSELIFGQLREYFPDEFDIDLNGRTLTYEAVCLIPFVKDDLFLTLEKELLEKNDVSPQAQVRNVIKFVYKSYQFDQNQTKNNKGEPKGLKSTLSHLNSLNYNNIIIQEHSEYAEVGKHSFKADLNPGVTLPQIDYPSFKWLGCKSVSYDEKVAYSVRFKIVLVKIPQAQEDAVPEDVEKFASKFIKQSIKELYIDFPSQHEAFPTLFEDKDFVYMVIGDQLTGKYRIHKEKQSLPLDQFNSRLKRINHKLRDQGFDVGSSKVIVTLNKVIDVKFDAQQNAFYKLYDEDLTVVPFGLIMKKRHTDHYLNVNSRINQVASSFKPKQPVICLNKQMFGVMGTVQQVESKKGIVQVKFDKEKEEAKLHDPFIGQINMNSKKEKLKNYFTDRQIEKDLDLKGGVINRVTGSVLIEFKDPNSKERQVIDLGLNIKNFTKKVHIPDYVKYVCEVEPLDFDDDLDQRGLRFSRKHWEYSQECFDIIEQYYHRFPEVFECVLKTMKNNKACNSLKDIYPNEDTNTAAKNVKFIAQWLESQPISKMPYVELGFDTLSTDMVKKLENHYKTVKENYSSIKLKCNDLDFIGMSMVYQEHFPFWSGPYSEKTTSDFKLGDRVMNLNSRKKVYIPFGLRGTVIGKTTENVIVLFDEQFLAGSSICGHCKQYKGAKINPDFLLNLTKKFTSIFKKDQAVVHSFQEQPLKGEGQKSGPPVKAPKVPKQGRTVTYVPKQKKGSASQGTNEEQKEVPSAFCMIDPTKLMFTQQELQQPQILHQMQLLGEDPSKGFMPNPELMGNPDYMSLVNMLASKKQMQPMNLTNQEEMTLQRNLNINASAFVPSTKKSAQDYGQEDEQKPAQSEAVAQNQPKETQEKPAKPEEEKTEETKLSEHEPVEKKES